MHVCTHLENIIGYSEEYFLFFLLCVNIPDWLWVTVQGMAEKGIEAVRNGEMQIIPQRFEKTWFNWLENIHDWCVSRQLWWGHRIPVWHVEGTGVFPVGVE